MLTSFGDFESDGVCVYSDGFVFVTDLILNYVFIIYLTIFFSVCLL